jgi:hypothetical protein
MEPLYRNNAKGEKGEWRCRKHLSPCSAPDKDTEKLCELLHHGQSKVDKGNVDE